MLLSALFLALSATATPVDDLQARATALRTELAAQDATPGLRGSLERQLLTSLERRIDLQHARDAAPAVPEQPERVPAEPPRGLLELDNLRREIQQLDLGAAAGTRRLEILHSDRDAAAARLTETVARLRQLDDAAGTEGEPRKLARVEVALAESTTAELDRLAEVIELQQQAARQRRDALSRRLAAVRMPVQPQPGELDAIEQRLAVRAGRLEQRLAEAAGARDAAHRTLEQQRGSAGAERIEALTEHVSTSDVAIELVREAQSNLTIERAAWQLVARFWRDNDPAAIIDARSRGPAVLASLQRRLEFMNASSEQLLSRVAFLDAQVAQAPDAPAAADWKEQRAALDERLRLLQGALLDQRRVLDLLARMRGDFDARIDAAGLADRVALAWMAARALLSTAWNFELFAVEQSVDVDGRQTAVPRSVTVAKIVKAPLLLLVGLFLAFRLTALAARTARKRGIDEGSVRMARRWTLGLLACACALSSLALAGIPLAAFAFIGGAIAIGIGFGMQTLLKNLISGLLVLVGRPFRLGDEIQVGDLRGTVVDIDLRASIVRDGDGSETLIPNSVLVEHNVRRVTSSRSKTIRQTLTIGVDPGADPREVIDTLRAAAQRHGLTHAREPHIFLDDCAADRLQFTMHYWSDSQPGGDRKRVASDLRMMLLVAFHAAGIRLAPATPGTTSPALAPAPDQVARPRARGLPSAIVHEASA